ncbi:WSSV200 [White spot syndrome virus]|uniref:WSSV200 n=1 Tax=White spot syndrome virus TaxID=342409 RepID=A0A2I6SBU9_9VIRU|nr:WSSV200 [White spot syndrome virus]
MFNLLAGLDHIEGEVGEKVNGNPYTHLSSSRMVTIMPTKLRRNLHQHLEF